MCTSEEQNRFQFFPGAETTSASAARLYSDVLLDKFRTLPATLFQRAPSLCLMWRTEFNILLVVGDSSECNYILACDKHRNRDPPAGLSSPAKSRLSLGAFHLRTQERGKAK